jgi:hypothetical protein
LVLLAPVHDTTRVSQSKFTGDRKDRNVSLGSTAVLWQRAANVRITPEYPDMVSVGWTQFVLGVVMAVTAASLLNYAVPRLYPYGDKDA